MIHAPTAVAKARPAAPSWPASTILSSTLTVSAVSEAMTGVAVSPRAKKLPATERISSTGINPSA